MIDFRPITINDKEKYEEHLRRAGERGCEFSFANLFLWGEQKIAYLHGHAVLFSRFGNHYVYPCPVGDGDKKAVFDAIIADAAERGIALRISGMRSADKQLLEELYPGKFEFAYNDGSFDYVYSIDDLAELKGKKYHGKRNHINRFREKYPDVTARAIGEENISAVKRMADEWFRQKMIDNPDGEYTMEKDALSRALENYSGLGMESMVLESGGRVLAFTLGNRLSDDTFDVNFEKAAADVDGGYPAVNSEFAGYIRSKYPEVRFLDREEDMGIEGLRKAKRSYHPHHMVDKYRASLVI